MFLVLKWLPKTGTMPGTFCIPLNQPTPKKSVLSVGNLTNHFFKNAQGGSLGSVLGSGLKGVMSGIVGDATLGSGASGAVGAR